MSAKNRPAAGTTLMTCERLLCATSYFLNEAPRSDRRIEQNFMYALGCPYRYSVSIEQPNRPPKYKAHLVIPEVPVDTITAVRESLPRVFSAVARKDAHYVVDLASLLAGMQRSQCWSSLLLDEERTYDLAIGVCKFLGSFNAEHSFYAVVTEDIVELLNGWLRPDVKWEKIPTFDEACLHMFGSAWCSLSSPLPRTIQALILRDRPAFEAGVCPSQAQLEAHPLPDLSVQM